MLPTGAFDYRTEKTFENPKAAARRAARLALAEKICGQAARRGGLLGCMLNRVCALLGWVHIRGE